MLIPYSYCISHLPMRELKILNLLEQPKVENYITHKFWPKLLKTKLTMLSRATKKVISHPLCNYMRVANSVTLMNRSRYLKIMSVVGLCEILLSFFKRLQWPIIYNHLYMMKVCLEVCLVSLCYHDECKNYPKTRDLRQSTRAIGSQKCVAGATTLEILRKLNF